VKRDALVELGVEWYGETFRAQVKSATKASIVERFEQLFHGPDEHLSPALLERHERRTIDDQLMSVLWTDPMLLPAQRFDVASFAHCSHGDASDDPANHSEGEGFDVRLQSN